MSNSNISDKFQVPEMNDTWTEKKWEENTYIINCKPVYNE